MLLESKSVPLKGAPFVTFEGIEGSGKTTQLGLLSEYFPGKAVLCDRFFDAPSAYQGFSRGIDDARIEEMNAFASGGLVPDLTFLFDIDPAAGFLRLPRPRTA